MVANSATPQSTSQGVILSVFTGVAGYELTARHYPEVCRCAADQGPNRFVAGPAPATRAGIGNGSVTKILATTIASSRRWRFMVSKRATPRETPLDVVGLSL